MDRCCKTCRWLKVEPDAAGRRVVRKGRAYPCEWPLPEMPALAASLRVGSHYRIYMEPGDGGNCPVWEPLTADLAPPAYNRPTAPRQ
jgi:hypothetical protein